MAVAGYQLVIATWDSWSRTNGLDPYFGAQKNTFWGQAWRAVFNANPLWVFGLIAVLVILWCIEPYWRRDKGAQNGQEPKSLNDAVRTDLIISLDDEKRKREQAERERDAACQVKDHTIASMQTAMRAVEEQRERALRESFKWMSVAYLVVSYERLTSLLPILEEACRKMDGRLPPRGETRLESVAEQMHRSGEINAKEFDEIRPRLVQVLTEMRTQHGLANQNLTEQKITATVYGAGQVRKMIEGIKTIAVSLRELIADAAVSAVNYQNKQ